MSAPDPRQTVREPCEPKPLQELEWPDGSIPKKPKIIRRTRLLALAPLLACLLCPGHLLALAAVLGLAEAIPNDPHTHFESWLVLGATAVLVVLVEVWVHRRHHRDCGHQHGSSR